MNPKLSTVNSQLSTIPSPEGLGYSQLSTIIEFITFGKSKIFFEIEFRNRKTLEISVLPDLTVKVISPIGKKIDLIKEKVLKRAQWILKQISYFKDIAPKTSLRKYISGETHRYLGRQYRLKIIQSKNEQIKFLKGYIYIYTPDKGNVEQIKETLSKWCRQKAKIKFSERIFVCYEKLKKYGIEKPDYQIKSMQKRWGSCTNKGKLLLNPELIKVSSYCIDYVITHELCHLKYYNHDKIFYNFLTQIMPDWKERKVRLENSEF